MRSRIRLTSLTLTMTFPRSRRRLFLSALFATSAAVLCGCSPLAVINGFTPSDTYRSTTGLAYGALARQRLDVYRPAHVTGTAPVVVFFYGGNWNSGERSDYLFVAEALASRGFVVVLADYRLYPEVRFPDFLDDCALAVRWAFEHGAEYGGDTRNLYLMGHSAGAYNAAMLALNPQYLRGAGIDTKRLRGLITLAGPFDFLPLQNEVSKKVFGFPDTPLNTQPIQFASASAPPALLLTTKEDDVVDPGNSVRLGARLRSQGVTVTEVVYPRLSHRTIVGALSRPLRSFAPVLDDVAKFIGVTRSKVAE